MAEVTDIRCGGLVLGLGDPDRPAAWYTAAFGGNEAPPSLDRPGVQLGGGARCSTDAAMLPSRRPRPAASS